MIEYRPTAEQVLTQVLFKLHSNEWTPQNVQDYIYEAALNIFNCADYYGWDIWIPSLKDLDEKNNFGSLSCRFVFDKPGPTTRHHLNLSIPVKCYCDKEGYHGEISYKVDKASGLWKKTKSEEDDFINVGDHVISMLRKIDKDRRLVNNKLKVAIKRGLELNS